MAFKYWKVPGPKNPLRGIIFSRDKKWSDIYKYLEKFFITSTNITETNKLYLIIYSNY